MPKGSHAVKLSNRKKTIIFVFTIFRLTKHLVDCTNYIWPLLSLAYGKADCLHDFANLLYILALREHPPGGGSDQAFEVSVEVTLIVEA